MNSFAIIEEFERSICDYTGAPYAVAVNSCSNALFLSLCCWRRFIWGACAHARDELLSEGLIDCPVIVIPKHTYVSVPMQIIHAGCVVEFEDLEWDGGYQLKPAPIWDYARRFTGGMFDYGCPAIELERRFQFASFQCVSFHWTKPLGIQHGGAILHNVPSADEWLRRARFDGRLPGEAAGDARIIGYHCLTTPEVAAAGLVRIANLPRNNPDALKSEYPDLSRMEIFR